MSLLLPRPFYSLHKSPCQTSGALFLPPSGTATVGESLDDHPVPNTRAEREVVSGRPQGVERGGTMLDGKLQKSRNVAYLPKEETGSVGFSLRRAHRCHLLGPAPCPLPVPSGPPSTTILASANKVKGGDDISVLCTVLGEPDVEVEFRWIYPGLKVRVSQSQQPSELSVAPHPPHPCLSVTWTRT